MKKNIFIIPLAAAAILFVAAIFLSPMKALPAALCLIGLAASGAAVYLAKNAGKNELAALLEPMEALSRNQNANFPENMPDDVKRLADAAKHLAEKRDQSAELAESLALQVEEYKKQLNEELDQGQKRSAEHSEFQRSLRHKTHRTQLVYNNLASEIHYLSQMVADTGHGMETQKYSMRHNDVVMTQIVNSIDGVSKIVALHAENSQKYRAKANSGHASVSGAAKAMNEAKNDFAELDGSMRLLGQQTKEITAVMNVINEVADQTVQLAMKSAIEAAKAGDAGQGFAVVADEVRKLAEKTMQATGDIRGVARDIQDAAKQNIRSVESVSASIAESSEQLARAESLMSELEQSIIESSEEMQKINGVIGEQTKNSLHAGGAMQGMQTVIRKSADNMIDFTGRLVSIADSVEELEITTGMLRGLTEYESTKRSRIVEWHPSLATGIELIDYQHKMLCLYINTLYRATVNGADIKVLNNIVDFLKVYTATHFATEERYFEQSGYPDAANHKQIHQKFVEKVVQVQKDIYSGNITIGNDLLSFLKDWLVNHIRGTDHEYATFLKAYLATVKE